MNCQEVHQLLGTAVDGVLGSGDKDAFMAHVGACPPCRKEFELETVAKRIVRTCVQRVAAPMTVRSSIMAAVRQEFRPAADQGSFLDRWIDRVFPAPAIAMGLALLAFLYLVSPQQRRMPVYTDGPNDVITQTLSNFELIKSGSLKPALMTADPELAASYFEPHQLAFDVDLRKLSECAGYGTIANEYNGVKLAHVVYKIGDDLVYVYEVKCEEVMNGRTLSLPKRVKAQIASGGWYVENDDPTRTLAVWDKNGTLCVATSTMKKEKMLALLATR